MGEYDSAQYFYDRMLSSNSELVSAIGGKVRVELKRKHDADARKYAMKAYSIDSTNSSSLEAMSLVCYFDNRNAESKRYLSDLKRLHPNDSVISSRTEDIIEGKTIYR